MEELTHTVGRHREHERAGCTGGTRRPELGKGCRLRGRMAAKERFKLEGNYHLPQLSCPPQSALPSRVWQSQSLVGLAQVQGPSPGSVHLWENCCWSRPALSCVPAAEVQAPSPNLSALGQLPAVHTHPQ